MAPAIHHADRQALLELMRALRDLVQRARAGGLRSSELMDPTVTVTSLGDRGAESVFGVIYPPQVAIIGFGRVLLRPWVVDGVVVARPVVVVTLAADHRASDGHLGGQLRAAIDRALQSPELLEAGAAMNEHDIRALAAEVLAGIAPEADLSTVGDSEDLREALDLDSMDFLNFVIGLGERTGLKIPEADTHHLHTLKGLTSYLAR